LRRNRAFKATKEESASNLDPILYDERTDDSFCIRWWSPEVGRSGPTFKLETAIRPQQRWLDASDHQRRVKAISKEHQNDPLAYLVDFAIDTGEGPQSERFRMGVTEGTYAEQMATIDCLKADPKARRAVRAALGRGDTLEFAASAPPSSIGAMVAVTSPSGRFLAAERSGSVQYERHEWTVGLTELMKPYASQKTPHHDRGPVEVVIRCLEEELGLGTKAFTNPFISWIGYWAPSTCVNFVAHVEVLVEEDEVKRRWRQHAQHGWEIHSIEWLPLDASTVSAVAANRQRGRRWTVHSRLMLKEVIRVREGLAQLNAPRDAHLMSIDSLAKPDLLPDNEEV
jgi:NUDIX domain